MEKQNKIKQVAIVQSNYIPWKGFFDLVNLVDEVILYDDMQYTRRDWRNRNLIKTTKGLEWLTIPVAVKGKYYQKIRETKISDKNWAKSHWAKILANYSKALYFNKYRAVFEELYLACNEEYLSNVNYRFLSEICRILGITTKLTWSMDYELVEGKSERLVGLCKASGANQYVSGPLARDYLDVVLFEKENIAVSWMDYSGYQEYKQLFPPFEHGVSILDLLFNTGPEAKGYMKSFYSMKAKV